MHNSILFYIIFKLRNRQFETVNKDNSSKWRALNFEKHINAIL